MNLRSLLGDNLVLKVLALLLAFGAWLVAQGEQVHRVTVEVPVLYQQPEGDRSDPAADRLIMTNDARLPAMVSVQVSGTRVAINRFVSHRDKLRYTVDWKDASAGLHVHSFRRIPGGVATDLVLDAVSPAEVEATFDVVDSVTLPVRLRRAGVLPAGLREGSARVNPERVTLVGSRRELSQLEVIETEPLRLNELTEKGYLDELALELGGLHLLPESPREVSVVVEVEADIADGSFGNVSLDTVESMAGFVIRPDHCAVVLTGPPEIIRALRPRDVRAVVSGEGDRLDFSKGLEARIPALVAGSVDADAPSVRIYIDHPGASQLEVEVKPTEFLVAPATNVFDSLRPELLGETDD